jgi:hypothetical protein
VVEQVTEHHASCTGGSPQAGDRFPLEPPAATAPPPGLPRPQTPAELASERQSLTAAAIAPVEFHGGPSDAGSRPLRAEATWSQRSWFSSELRPWQEERVDARLGTPLGSLAFLDLDATALHLRRPDGTERFRPGDENQLYLWRAEVAFHGPGGTGLSGSLGRLIPASAPGAQRIDGAWLGYRFSGSELGIFGGGIPDAQTLAPAADRDTIGAFFSLGRSGDRDGAVSYAQATARVAWVRAPESGTRVEGEANTLLQLWRKLDVAASARLAVGDLQAPGALDAARVSLDLRPFDGLSLSGAFRYQGSRLPIDSTGLVIEGPTRNGELSGTWSIAPSVVLGAEAGLSQDLLSSTSQQWVGPTLSLPVLFGALGGLLLGYQQELGAAPGRTAYVQGALLPGRRLQLITRASLFVDVRPDGSDDVEVGLFVRLVARITDHLGFHFSAMGRLQPVAVGAVPAPLPYGAWLDAGISGEL